MASATDYWSELAQLIVAGATDGRDVGCQRQLTSCVISPSQITSYHFVLLLYMYDATLQCFVLRRPAAPAHPHWLLLCDRYKSIDIEVSISISILLWQSIDIGIDDTFKAGIDIEYRRYFWKISITTLLRTVTHSEQVVSS